MKSSYLIIALFLFYISPAQSQVISDSLQAFQKDSNFVSQNLYADSVQLRDSLFVDSLNRHPFTINYSISTATGRRRGIAETYNGAIKTLFVNDDKVKIKLSSLMRTQYLIYYIDPQPKQPQAVMVKESSKEKYILRISPDNWPVYSHNELYAKPDSLPGDTLVLFGIKANAYQMKLPDGKILKAYVVNEVDREVLKKSEPFLELFPGLPLQYAITKGNQSITFTATAINFVPIPVTVFDIPVKGYKVKKFVRKKGEKKLTIEDDDDADDEESTETDSSLSAKPTS